MKIKTIFILSNLLAILTAFSQTKSILPPINGTFCGKFGPDDPKKYVIYSMEELKQCDLKISAIDTNYFVTDFKLSLVPKDDSYKYLEMKINSNRIPEKYRSQILNHTQIILLEFINSQNIKGESRLVKPIGLRIQN